MASSKEMLQTSRPLTHRPSISATNSSSSGLTTRQSHSRTSSHSVLTSALNANHRVTRRKSMTNTAANAAAVAAVLSEAAEVGDKATALPISISSRRNTMSKPGASRSAIAASLPSAPASGMLADKSSVLGVKPSALDSAIDDDPQDTSADDGDLSHPDTRMRRASDGQPLVKEGGIRKINRVELKCDKCGKGYKHSSCLTKHLWEHTPEWSFTSKLLISKHQQVQLLEAASVLVGMNVNPPPNAETPPDSARDFTSDQDSASPAASGYSDLQDDRSSADTTPPPHADTLSTTTAASYRTLSKRYSSGSGFSRSYQSAPSASSIASSVPNGNGHGFSFGHLRQLSQEQRPLSSGKNTTGQEDRDLAAAVELLSCSFGSNNGSRMVHLDPDAPPVPPLPAQYLDQATGASFISGFPRGAPESFTRGERRPFEIKKEENADSVMDEDDFDDARSRARSDEDDDGVFGRMEE